MANSGNRTRNSIYNFLFALIGQGVDVVIKFVLRTAFISTLGKEYLGLNGLFTNILSFLSLAELGVGAAITYSLYEPIANNDELKILPLMALYKKAYTIIGTGVIIIGISLTPFLKLLIAEMPNIDNIELIYILFVINSGISYFFSYKSSFISANQKNYIVSNVTNIVLAFTSCIQVAILFLTKNYILYLIIQIFGTIVSYLILSRIANKNYPLLKKSTHKALDADTKAVVTDNIKATLYHRIGANVVYSTDNILLSKIFGLIEVGLYSNYALIITTLERLFAQFFTAITASVGNLRVSTDDKHQALIYSRLFFMQFWIYSFASVSLGTLIDPFIGKIWLDESYLMQKLCVIFIVINFYLKGMRQVNQVFNQSYGLLREYKYAPLPEIIINIVASVLLAKVVGPAGIFIGTTISTLCVMFWKEPQVLFKLGFYFSTVLYYKKYLLYMCITASEYIVLSWISDVIPFTGLLKFIFQALLCVIIPNLLLIILFNKTEEFQYTIKLIKRIVKREV